MGEIGNLLLAVVVDAEHLGGNGLLLQIHGFRGLGWCGKQGDLSGKNQSSPDATY